MLLPPLRCCCDPIHPAVVCYHLKYTENDSFSFKHFSGGFLPFGDYETKAK